MPSFNFDKEKNKDSGNNKVDKVVIKKQADVVINPSNDNLDKVKILKQDEINVVRGSLPEAPTFITGQQGPTGPTGPTGGVNYFYSETAPVTANTGDRWFHPRSGLEFVKIQSDWIHVFGS
tara:strand:- start:477 stop:839 length:363 start_codon:yes stop_codon:yes gene_type:complete